MWKLVSNFGPSHPAAHGVLRLIVFMYFEIILCLDFELGLLFRSTEIFEFRQLSVCLGYIERTDYVSSGLYAFGASFLDLWLQLAKNTRNSMKY